MKMSKTAFKYFVKKQECFIKEKNIITLNWSSIVLAKFSRYHENDDDNINWVECKDLTYIIFLL